MSREKLFCQGFSLDRSFKRNRIIESHYLPYFVPEISCFCCCVQIYIIFRVPIPLSSFAFLPHWFFAIFSVIFGHIRRKDSLTPSKFFKDESHFVSGKIRLSICLACLFFYTLALTETQLLPGDSDSDFRAN